MTSQSWARTTAAPDARAPAEGSRARAAEARRSSRPRARRGLRPFVRAMRTPLSRARTATTRRRPCGRRAPRAGATRRRSDPRNRARAQERHPTTRSRSSGARPPDAATRRGPTPRADRAPPGTPVRTSRAARRDRPARAARRPARQALARVRPRSPDSVPPPVDALVDRASHHHRTLGVSEQPRPPPSPRASDSNSVSNVATVPASKPPWRRTSSRSTCSTSVRFGTISQGSRSIVSTIAIEQRRDLACMRRTDDESETHRCMVVRGVSVPALRLGRKRREKPLRA